MARGRGVRLQKYRDGGLADIATFTKKQGLVIVDASGRTRTFTDLKDWIGARGNAGRLPPKGFPRRNKLR